MGKIRTTFYLDKEVWKKYKDVCQNTGDIPSRMLERFMLCELLKLRRRV